MSHVQRAVAGLAVFATILACAAGCAIVQDAVSMATVQVSTIEQTRGVQYQVDSSGHRQPASKGTWYSSDVDRIYVGVYPVPEELRTYSRQFLADYNALNIRSMCEEPGA